MYYLSLSLLQHKCVLQNHSAALAQEVEVVDCRLVHLRLVGSDGDTEIQEIQTGLA